MGAHPIFVMISQVQNRSGKPMKIKNYSVRLFSAFDTPLGDVFVQAESEEEAREEGLAQNHKAKWCQVRVTNNTPILYPTEKDGFDVDRSVGSDCRGNRYY